eukprot:COSAG02_NODE_11790_length_1654_cov_1.329260_1_plen_416_part_01
MRKGTDCQDIAGRWEVVRQYPDHTHTLCVSVAGGGGGGAFRGTILWHCIRQQDLRSTRYQRHCVSAAENLEPNGGGRKGGTLDRSFKIVHPRTQTPLKTRSRLDCPGSTIRGVPLQVALQVLLPLCSKATNVTLKRFQVRVLELVSLEVFTLLCPVTTAWPFARERPLATVGRHVSHHVPRGVGDILAPRLGARPLRTLPALAAASFADCALNTWLAGSPQGFPAGPVRCGWHNRSLRKVVPQCANCRHHGNLRGPRASSCCHVKLMRSCRRPRVHWVHCPKHSRHPRANLCEGPCTRNRNYRCPLALWTRPLRQPPTGNSLIASSAIGVVAVTGPRSHNRRAPRHLRKCKAADQTAVEVRLFRGEILPSDSMLHRSKVLLTRWCRTSAGLQQLPSGLEECVRGDRLGGVRWRHVD